MISNGKKLDLCHGAHTVHYAQIQKYPKASTAESALLHMPICRGHTPHPLFLFAKADIFISYFLFFHHRGIWARISFVEQQICWYSQTPLHSSYVNRPSGSKEILK
jgi:hypothetical protein